MSESTSGGRNAIVLQSGGVTAVINQSLAGVVQEALCQPAIGEIYGAVHGLDGILAKEIRDLKRQPRGTWPAIGRTPGAALGSARRKLQSLEVPQVLDRLRELGVAYLFAIGGNDSAETAHLLAREAASIGYGLNVVGVPKTVDNDLPEMDHCPGYGSAARFVALATMGAGRDAESMGHASPITIIEVMGRNAGWLAAAAALGKREERDAPHVICVPETRFVEERFIAQMEEAYKKWGFAVAVVNENIKDSHGPVGHMGDPLIVDDFGHPYYQSPGQYLAGQISRRLGVRVRFEKPGTIQRSLTACTSDVDAAEAYLVGKQAVRAAVSGHTDVMVTLLRLPSETYHCATGLAPLEAIAARERVMPSSYFDAATGLPTKEFADYARPLLGAPLPRFARLR
ncbi:MAG: diphosphate--fructose-6-phosphate 1-phosphotransferase [Dehalococcoidia bacterium]|nr:diphosphate--fructose-6-phosphate 1-phosphotransferase [Dehalococcoidia bacterium]